MTTTTLRSLMDKGYRPVECPSCTGKTDADGRPVVVWVMQVPTRHRRSR